MSEIERRTFAGPVTMRAEGEGRKLAGHGAVFNQETVIWGMWREVILPGAFTEAIKTDDVRALQNHNPDLVLGRNKSGTLSLNEDDIGLAYEIDPPDTTYARDLLAVVQRGDVSQSSFGFSIDSSDWEEWDYSETKQGKLPLRKIKRVSLMDVSPVTFPAFTGTDVSARSKELAAKRPEVPPVITEQEIAENEARADEDMARRARLDYRRRKLELETADD